MNTTTSSSQNRSGQRAMIQMAATSVLSALGGVVLVWAVMGHQPAAATAQVEATAAWAAGNWGDTTVPAATFAGSDASEPVTPTF